MTEQQCPADDQENHGGRSKRLKEAVDKNIDGQLSGDQGDDDGINGAYGSGFGRCEDPDVDPPQDNDRQRQEP